MYDPGGTFESYNDGGAATPRTARWWIVGNQECIRWDDQGQDLCRYVTTDDNGHYFKELVDHSGRRKRVVTYHTFVGPDGRDRRISGGYSVEIAGSTMGADLLLWARRVFVVLAVPEELGRRFRDALTEAVAAAAGSERPVCVALSGGIDSSAIAAAAVDAFGAGGVEAITYEFGDPDLAFTLETFGTSLAVGLVAGLGHRSGDGRQRGGLRRAQPLRGGRELASQDRAHADHRLGVPRPRR